METIDIVFLSIIGINGLLAFRRGMIKTLFSFFSTIIAVFLSYAFYSKLSSLIISYTDIDQSIQDKISSALNLDKLTEGISTKQEQITLISDLEVPNAIKEYLLSNNNTEVYELLDVSAIGDYITNMISRMVVNALAFVICFIAFSILIYIISNVLDLIVKLPILKQINRTMGLLIGVALGVLIDWIICLVIYVIAGVNGNSELLMTINESTVSQFIYNNNPLIDLITDVTKVFN